jgi:hypothetical protein
MALSLEFKLMRNLRFLLFLSLLYSCTHPGNISKDSGSATYSATLNDTGSFNDGHIIALDSSGNCRVTRGMLCRILRRNPELNEQTTESPDLAYAEHTRNMDFESEQGKDEYFLIYAYFGAIRNGQTKCHGQRDSLIRIYRDINKIFDGLANGGTYFGHQYARIAGYAEYSVYLYKRSALFMKGYGINAQKNLYLKSVKQLIDDETSVNFDTPDNDKLKLKQELLKTLKDMDSLITDYFYLNRAREFQYSNY